MLKLLRFLALLVFITASHCYAQTPLASTTVNESLKLQLDEDGKWISLLFSDSTSLSSASLIGDVVGPSSSVDSEIAIFSGTGGKILKRATQTGVLKASAGVISSSTYLGLTDGGTGTNTAAGARTNLGAAASGTNTDITSLTPGTNFTLNQNSVAPFTSVSSGAVANTLYLNAGSVGIGTSTPASQATMHVNCDVANALRVTGSSQGRILLEDTGATADQKLWEWMSDGGVLSASRINDAQGTRTTYLTIDNSGKVGIGTASPMSKLHIYNGSSGQSPSASGMIIESNTHQYVTFAAPADKQQLLSFNSGGQTSTFGFEGGTRGGLFQISVPITNSLTGFDVQDISGNSRLRVLSGGNVGIGTTAPLNTLSVKAAGKLGLLESYTDVNNYSNYEIYSDSNGYNHKASQLGTGIANRPFIFTTSGTSTSAGFIIKDSAGTAKVTVLDNGAITLVGNITVPGIIAGIIVPTFSTTTLGLNGKYSSTSSGSSISVASTSNSGQAFTNTTGTYWIFDILPTYNQVGTSTSVNYDLRVNRTETSISATALQRLASFGVGGASYVERWGVGNLGKVYQSSLDGANVVPTRPIQTFKHSKSVADDGVVTLFEITTTGHGLVTCGDMTEYTEFWVNSTGTVTLVGNSANVVANADTDTKLCIGTAASQEPLQIKNRLGGTNTVNIVFEYD